jgi:hypothetical protein
MEQQRPVNKGKIESLKNYTLWLGVFSPIEVNQSTGFDTIASFSAVAEKENRFYEQNMTTTTQSLIMSSSPILQRRRIDQPIASNSVPNNTSYLNIRSICRSFREFHNWKRILYKQQIFIMKQVTNSIHQVKIITSKFKYNLKNTLNYI